MLEDRSQARMRALAVARREGRGGGGVRDVVSVVRKDGDGEGRDWAARAERSCPARSMVKLGSLILIW